jgi:hypothetical protein
VQPRPVDLRDRRGRDRLRIELREDVVRVGTEFLPQHGRDLVGVGVRDLVLEFAQFVDEHRWKNIGARREELAELHERHAALLQRAPQ